MELNTIYNEDCLVGMAKLVDGSIDMILCDLPYGTTACKWDSTIPFEPLWEQYERIIKSNGAIVLFGSQPFTSALILSNPKLFRYEIIWEKTLASNFFLARKQPLKKHENICVFYKEQPTYNPQMIPGKPYKDKARKRTVGVHGNTETTKAPIDNKGERYPGSVQVFSNGNNKTLHPTQKPVPLLEWLVKTYTNKGDLVLDNCMGSGSTAVACLLSGRRFLGFELDPKFHSLAQERVGNIQNSLTGNR